jgi:hypothetical protein
MQHETTDAITPADRAERSALRRSNRPPNRKNTTRRTLI